MLIYTNIKNATHLVNNGRVIPFTKQIANVPFEVQKELVGQPHIEEFTGQVDLPEDFNDYAEGKVGDPVMEDFVSTEEVAKAQKKK